VKPGENDDYFLVFGPEEDCRTAANEIRIRFADATEGMPKETRQALTRRPHHLRADPPRARPDVSRHRLAADARSPRSAWRRSGAPQAAPWERIARYSQWRVPDETTTRT
jgi:hypothetical protein